MKYDLIIAHGTVILEHDAVQADIAVKDGKIAAIGKGLGEAQKTIDATGCIVSPGMVDAHVHLSEPGRTDWEGYDTGTKAAAKGGITTCIEMPLNQLPATVDRESLRLKFDASKGKLRVDIAPFGGLVPYNLDRLHELDEEGVVAYKCFLATCGDPNVENDFANVNDYSFLKGLQILAKRDQLVAVHAENAAICDGLGKDAVREGRLTAYDYVASRPVYAEVEAIRRAIFLAKVAGCRLHICHISCPEGVDEVTKARQAGQDVTCETCIHYLTLDTDQFDKIGALAKCSPPIRDHKNQERMWEKLLAGEIDCVASDHSPCVPSMKEGNIMKAWGGLASLQNNVDLLFDEGVKKRHMDLTLFAKLTASNPADIFRLKDKGRLEVGKDADIVLIDPKASYTLQASDLEYRHKISAFVGRKIDARIKMTVVRGNVVYCLDQGFDEKCVGKFVFKSK